MAYLEEDFDEENQISSLKEKYGYNLNNRENINLISGINLERKNQISRKFSLKNICSFTNGRNSSNKSLKEVPLKIDINKLVLTFKDLRTKLDSMDFQKIIGLIAKHPNARNSEEIQLIMNFLSKTNLIKILQENLISDFNISLSLFNISKNVEYLFHTKNLVLKIFQTGLSDRFHIIIKGKLRLLKISEKLQEFTIEQFFRYLDIMQKNENYLMEYLINNHQNLLAIDMNNINKYYEFFFQKKLFNLIHNKESARTVMSVIKRYSHDQEKNGLEIKELEKLEFSINSSEKDIGNLYIKFVKLLEKSDYFKEDFLEKIYSTEELEFLNSLNIEETKLFKIYKSEISKYFTEGDFIGETDISPEIPSDIAIIIVEEDTHIVTLKKEIYNEHILSEKNRIMMKNLQFLYDLIFAKFLNKNVFEKKYFNSFIYGELAKGQILFRENEKMEYVYFIIDGNLDLFIKKNIISVNEDLINFINLHEEFHSIYSNPEVTKILTNFKNFTDTFFYNKNNAPLPYFQKEEKEKNKAKESPKKNFRKINSDKTFSFTNEKEKIKDNYNRKSNTNSSEIIKDPFLPNRNSHLKNKNMSQNENFLVNNNSNISISPKNQSELLNNVNFNLVNINNLDSEKLELCEELKKVKEFSLKRVSNNEILGLENYIFNKPSYFKAVVVSNKLSYFKVDVKIIQKMIIAERYAEDFIKEICNVKIFSLIRRLFEMIKNLSEIKNIQKINKNRILNKKKNTDLGLNNNIDLNKKNFLTEISPNRKQKNNEKIHNSPKNKYFYSPLSKNSKEIFKYDELSPKRKKENSEEIKINSDKKFVLNSLKEFHDGEKINYQIKMISHLNINEIENSNHYQMNNLNRILNFNNFLFENENSMKGQNNSFNKLSKFQRQSEKFSFADLVKENEKEKGEFAKLETIHEQKYDSNTAKKSKNSGENFKNNSFNAKKKNEIFSTKLEQFHSVNNYKKNMSFLEVSQHEERKKVYKEKKKFYRLSSDNKISEFFKNYENSHSEKTKNDQILYAIRKNIHEIKLNNPLLGGRRKNKKMLSLKKKDYFIKKNTLDEIIFDKSPISKADKGNISFNNSININLNTKLKKHKYSSSIIKKEIFGHNYSFDYGNILKNSSFINFAGDQKIKKIENFSKIKTKNPKMKDQSTNTYDAISLTEHNIINTHNVPNNSEKKRMSDKLLNYKLDSDNKISNTEIFHDNSFDSNRFSFDEVNKNYKTTQSNFDYDYVNTAPERKIKNRSLNNQNINSNLPFLNLILHTNDSNIQNTDLQKKYYNTIENIVVEQLNYCESRRNASNNGSNIKIEYNIDLENGMNEIKTGKKPENIDLVSKIEEITQLNNSNIYNKDIAYNLVSKNTSNVINKSKNEKKIISSSKELNLNVISEVDFEKKKNKWNKRKLRELSLNFNNLENISDEKFYEDYENKRKNLENLDDSKIETKSIFSNKLFSDNSIDEGIREQILSSNSFFSKTKNKFDQRDKKEFERFKNQTNNFSFLKSDYKYLPIEKSIEAKRLNYLKRKTKLYLESLKSNPVEYIREEVNISLKIENNEKIQNLGRFVSEKDNNKENFFFRNFEIFPNNDLNSKENSDKITSNNYLISLNQIKKNLPSENSLNKREIRNKITNINYDFMKEYNGKKPLILKDNYYFENYIKKQKESIEKNIEFINNLKNESEQFINNDKNKNLYSKKNSNSIYFNNQISNIQNPLYNLDTSGNLKDKIINRKNHIFSPFSLNSLNSKLLLNKQLINKNSQNKNFDENIIAQNKYFYYDASEVEEKKYRYEDNPKSFSNLISVNNPSQSNKNENSKLKLEFSIRNKTTENLNFLNNISSNKASSKNKNQYKTFNLRKTNDKEVDINQIIQQPKTPILLNSVNYKGEVIKKFLFSGENKVIENNQVSEEYAENNFNFPHNKITLNHIKEISKNSKNPKIYKNNLKEYGSFVMSPIFNQKLKLNNEFNFKNRTNSDIENLFVKNPIILNSKIPKAGYSITNDSKLYFDNEASINEEIKQSFSKVDLNLNIYPKDEILEKMQRLKLFPKLNKKYLINKEKKFDKYRENHKQNLNLKMKEDYNVFSDLENSEFIENDLKSPRLRKNRSIGNEIVLKSPSIGKYYSKIKKL